MNPIHLIPHPSAHSPPISLSSLCLLHTNHPSTHLHTISFSLLPSTYLSIDSSVHPPTHPYIHHLSTHLSINQSRYPSTHPLIYHPTYPHIHISTILLLLLSLSIHDLSLPPFLPLSTKLFNDCFVGTHLVPGNE